MNCDLFHEYVASLAGKKPLEAGFQRSLSEHARQCAHCRERWLAEEHLSTELGRLRRLTALQTAPESMESNLLAVFTSNQERNQRGPFQRWERWLAWPLALAASIALLSWITRHTSSELAPASAPLATASVPVEVVPAATAFLPLVSIDEIRDNTHARVVETQMPRTALASFGLPINPERASEPVRSEWLIGEDGSILAVRFIN